ncbi:MAG: hypothetical protein ACREIA_10645 [Opitutaceae bacterium]
MSTTPTTTTTDPATSIPAPAPGAARAFGGVWRLTYPRFLAPGNVLAQLGLAVGLALFGALPIEEGQASHYFNWVVLFYLTFLVPALAFLSGAGALRDEMKPTAVDYVHTRPIRRAVLVAFKFAAHFLCSQASLFVALAVVVGVGVFRDIPGTLGAAPLMWLGQALGGAVFMALGFFFASLTSRYLVLGLLYGAVIEAGIGNIPTQLAGLSLTRHLKNLLAPVHADLVSLFSDAPGAGSTVTALLVVTALLLAASALIFNRREFAGARPKDL